LIAGPSGQGGPPAFFLKIPFTKSRFYLNICNSVLSYFGRGNMLFEYRRKSSKEEIILTDGRTKAEADEKMRDMIKRSGGLIKDWSLSWSC
jgi:hypothetical protein